MGHQSDKTVVTDENNQEQCGPDGRADAFSATALVLLVVVTAVFWVANQ